MNKHYFNPGDRFFQSIRGLIKKQPTYVNNETGDKLTFWTCKSNQIEVMIQNVFDSSKTEWIKGTSSMRVLNKRIAQYGLQFTDIDKM